MKVSGIVVWRVLLGAVLGFLVVCQLDDWSHRGKIDDRLDQIVKEGDMMLEDVKMRDVEYKVRDSILTEAIREGKERMEELARLREMTGREVVLLKDSVKIERVRFDSLSKTMIDW